MNIQETIFEAIEIIADKKISEIPFDKTIEGMVWTGSKPDLGEYQIKYQDIVFTAFSNVNTVKYKPTTSEKSPDGDVVYVLIPQGDFGSKKTIVGKKEAKGEEFIDIVDMIEKIQLLGDNYVDEEEGFSVNFPAGVDNSQELKLRKQDLINDFPFKTNLLIGGTITSDLESEKGDFGIELDVVYDNSINHTYRISLVDMVGNPYRLRGNYQYKVFTLARNQLTQVIGARAYIEGFSTSVLEGMGVVFSNIEIQYVKPKDAEGLENFSAKLKTPLGNTFKNGSINPESALKLTMSLSKLGKEFSPNAAYKWYIMDSTIDNIYHPDTDMDGGIGWRLLKFNEEGVTEDGNISLEEEGKTLLVTAEAVPNFETFKCFSTFGGETIDEQEYGAIKLEAIETLIDQTDGLSIAVVSTKGDAFKENTTVEETELVCQVYLGGELVTPIKFVYTWIRIEDDGSQTILSRYQESEKLTVRVKDDIINTRNYICEVFLKE